MGIVSARRRWLLAIKSEQENRLLAIPALDVGKSLHLLQSQGVGATGL
jgi:hypothetical protein